MLSAAWKAASWSYDECPAHVGPIASELTLDIAMIVVAANAAPPAPKVAALPPVSVQSPSAFVGVPIPAVAKSAMAQMIADAQIAMSRSARLAFVQAAE